MKITAVITGGSGFIGSHLAEKLVILGHKVIVIDNFCNGSLKNLEGIRKKIHIINADICNFSGWNHILSNKVYFFHLAALADIVPSIQNPDLYFKNNVVGTFKILEACKKFGVKKIIYAASASCYGIPTNLPVQESDKINPKYPYALTKAMGEELLIHWSKIYKLNYVSLRLFNVYGRRSRTTGAYGAMFGVFLAQKFRNLPLTVVGNGRQKRDFVHVSDVADAFIKSAKSRIYNQIFNVGSGKPTSVNDVVKLISQNKIYIKKRPAEPDLIYANIDKIVKKLKWKPKINIKEGVVDLLNNIDAWKAAPVWNVKKINKATALWFKYLK